jgi:hypothetical protein
MRSSAGHTGAVLTLVAAVGAFYALQFAGYGTIHWDAVDVHYTSQAFLSEQLRGGRLPTWTPYIFSGFPFLADPQVGTWYPPNWPFFAVGITPASIEYEMALHSLVACVGAYVLAFKLLRNPAAAVFAGLFYGLSGFFAGQSQAVGLSKAAALLPWLVFAVDRFGERLTASRVALAGVLGGLIILAGHFQTALYVFSASVLIAGLTIVSHRERWRRLVAGLALTGMLALGLAAIAVLPGLELARESARTNVDATSSSIMFFEPKALLTLFWPNALGALFGDYVGPRDLSQYYWYSGILFVPLVVLGCLFWRGRALAAVLTVPFVWYAAGPAGGLYLLVSRLPGFHSVVGPINGWFVAMLGLALLAAAGFDVLSRRIRWRFLPHVLTFITICDLVFWNSVANGLTYTRQDANTLYAQPLAELRARLSDLPPDIRLHTPELTRVGYLNWSLQLHVETTYGYNPLELNRYIAYFDAARTNPRLVDGLAANYTLSMADTRHVAALDPVPEALPLAYFARHVTPVSDVQTMRQRLLTLDPAQETLVEDPSPVPASEPAATATVVERDQDHLTVHYRSASPGLLRTAIPVFPGWHASIAGREVPTIPVDYAFVGAVVPAGEGDLVLWYTPNYLLAGAGVSLATLLVIALAVAKDLHREARRSPGGVVEHRPGVEEATTA